MTQFGPRACEQTGYFSRVVLHEHAAHDIIIDVEAEGMRDLLGDAHTAELGIAPFHFDNGCEIMFVTLRKTARRGPFGLRSRN